MYGVASAPAIWQRQMETLLQGIGGVTVFLDDIKITGPNDEIHLQRLEEVLARLRKHNMRVNRDKCEFFADKIEYCGYLIDREGIHKQKRKVQAIQLMKRPTNVDEIRAFVGLVNYYGRFLGNLSTILYPINNLLKKNQPFSWDSKCETAFDCVKNEMQKDTFLVHYDPKLPVILATDASSYGVGAVLSHIYPNGDERPIKYASQTLSAIQQKYTQIDKEAYAIIFGVKKFSQYLFGRKFTLIVDNKPLTQILAPHKGLPTFSALRMQHYDIFLRNFTFDIKYRSTKEHGNADAMSRLPMNVPDLQHKIQEYDLLELNSIETLPLRVEELSHATMEDKTVASLIQGLRCGREVQKNVRFGVPQTEFSILENCLMRGMRVYVPLKLRKQVLDELHSTHFGINRMKSIARSYCWWPGIDESIESLTKNCTLCQSSQANPPKVNHHCWAPATRPFERVHVDFAGPYKGVYFFVLVDAYSKWPEVFIMKSITTKKTIEICRHIFACFGMPSILVSDLGSQFTSAEFQSFLQMNGITHKKGAPYHPATNGQAERYVRTIKSKLKILQQSNEDDLHLMLSNILLTYRKTIHPSTGKSPAVLVFNREIKSRLDLMIPSDKPKPLTSRDVTRSFNAHDRVSVRDYLSTNKWNFGRVLSKDGTLHYSIILDDGRIWRRHVDQIRSVGADLLPRKDTHSLTRFPTFQIMSQPKLSESNDNNQPTTLGNTPITTTEEEVQHNVNQPAPICTDKAITSSPPNPERNHEHNLETNEQSVLRKSTRVRKPIVKLNL